MARKSSLPKSGITVGSRVSYRVGPYVRHAVVVEDRGNLGWRGQRILRIRTTDVMEEAQETFEIPEAEVTLEESQAA